MVPWGASIFAPPLPPLGGAPNAEVNYLTSATKRLWADLLETQPRAGPGAEASRSHAGGEGALDRARHPAPTIGGGIGCRAMGEGG